MSIWTHVAGLVRLDKLKGMNPITTSHIKSIFENMKPYGSEGPVEIAVVEHTHLDESAVVWCSVIIYGDLRDYEYKQVEEIKEWFTGTCDQLFPKGVIVRQAVMHIEVETGEDVILFHEDIQKWRVIE